MEALRIENLSFRYPNRGADALRNISLSVERGEFVTLIGPSGSGKTTLLRHLKPEIAPFGTRSGEVFFDEKPLETLSQREQSAKIGFVFQDPDDQIVTDKVWHELAFGLENLGLHNSEIRLRVAETAAFFGIEELFHREVSTLSGGQKQILNLASVMAMQPALLILDEPTGQLDPIAAGEFLRTVKRINLELGTTVILSEHRTEDAISLSDKLLVMDGGRKVADGTPHEVGERLRNSRMFDAMPTPMRVWAAVPNGLACPVSVREGRTWLQEFSQTRELAPIAEQAQPSIEAQTILELKDVWFRYSRDGGDVLRGLSAAIRHGEIFALMGGNGAGKTTALSVMAGLLKPYRGKVRCHGKAALLPQDPRELFLRPTLEEDLLDTFPDSSISTGEKRKLFDEIVSLCGLEGLLKSHPYDLSGGQRQMAALAKLLLVSPDILLLDEPTKGLDVSSKEKLSGILQKLCEKGKAVILVSHDVEFCAMRAHRCAMLFDGEVIGIAPPREFFGDKNYYTTAAHRMSRGILGGAILPEDIIHACGGATPPSSGDPIGGAVGADDPVRPSPVLPDFTPKKLSARSIISVLILLALIPLTVYFGLQYFGERKAYFVSLLVILEAMLPFFMIFEGRKPLARELVLIAVLCALAICGRVAFYMLPQVKPTLALIIIAGACFGGETGFMVGAVTALVSNFFFAQGPWTPWQMFAMGLTGFLAGLIFCRPRKSKLALSVYGFLACVVLYGGIMNASTVLMSQANPTWGAFLTAFSLGLPFDLLQGAATALFLWLISGTMLEKLNRIKTKFGIIRLG